MKIFCKKKRVKTYNPNDLKKIPTYYEPCAKNIIISKYRCSFQLKNNSEDKFKIYYYGKLIKRKLIVSTEDARSLIVARDKFGDEIVLFDGFIHGYDNLSWRQYSKKELNHKRDLIRLDRGLVQIFITVTMLDDEMSDWELDSNNNVTGDHNVKTPWEIFERNAITWLKIDIVTENNKKINIVDEELA